jgi:hypothetical protein
MVCHLDYQAVNKWATYGPASACHQATYRGHVSPSQCKSRIQFVHLRSYIHLEITYDTRVSDYRDGQSTYGSETYTHECCSYAREDK